MKKRALILMLVTLVLLVESMTLVFADAITYDMEPSDFYVYVVTPDGGLNMRHGPGTDYPKVMEKPIPDYEKLYIVYTSGDWGYTSYNGNEGWVCLIDTTTTPPKGESYDKKEAGYYVYVLTPDGGLNMRQGPSTSYGKVRENPIPDYEKLYIEYVSGDWGYTSFEGDEGWVWLPQTTTTLPTEEVIATPEPEPTETVTKEDVAEEAKNTVSKQIILIAGIMVFVVMIAVIILLCVNMKSKN